MKRTHAFPGESCWNSQGTNVKEQDRNHQSQGLVTVPELWMFNRFSTSDVFSWAQVSTSEAVPTASRLKAGLGPGGLIQDAMLGAGFFSPPGSSTSKHLSSQPLCWRIALSLRWNWSGGAQHWTRPDFKECSYSHFHILIICSLVTVGLLFVR